MRRHTTETHRSLLGIIRDVRRRWRIKLLLRGGAIVGGAALLVFVLSSWGLERLGFTPAALLWIRLGFYAILAALAFRYLVRPLFLRATDEQTALYLEEHEPELHELVLSALELERTGRLDPLARRTIERAMERCAALEDGRTIERSEIRRFGGAFGTVAFVALVLAVLQPALLRQGAGALLNPLRDLAASSPYAIEVEPGSITIPRGADQTITARLRGFAAADAELVVRSGSDSSFQRIPMFSAADSGAYDVLLFDVAQPTEYFVEAGGVRSAVYRIEVADLPYVKTLALEYRYPAYTGLAPERIEEGGDVAALRGTMVHVFAQTTVPATAGHIVLSTGARVPLSRDGSGEWTGAFRIEQQGFYHIELQATSGQVVTGSPEFTIDVLDDRAPTIRISKPGRDTRPTSVDEVFLEAQAEDDYGVRSIELLYSVNGGDEKRVEVYAGSALPEVTAGHTLYLEELGLQPGDIVSYYARARDNSGDRTVTSDIYFLTVRPFSREYRQAESGQQGGGGGEQGESAGELTQQQREIVAATFNLLRDSAQYTPSAYREYLNTIVLMQDRVREQALTLAQRMNNRGVTADSLFAQIAETLPAAAREMDSALVQLRGRGARPALRPEQRALQWLERAEALYREVQVQMQQQGGGGGGGGSPNAEDLADLFELELDKLRNQYETVQRGEREQQQQGEAGVDEALEKLRELARRLQQENERMRRQAMQGQQGGGSSGGSQRQMAEQMEQAARELQRLSREQQRDPELERAARELEQAADALRRGAADARTGQTANSQQALDRLRDATRRLENQRGSGIERQTRDALRRAEQIAEQQQQTGQQMENAAREGASAQQVQELINRRTQQLAQTQQLEQEIDRLAQGTRREQRDASRRLQEAADAIRQTNLKEMQSFSRNLMRDRASGEMVEQFEQRIESAMDSVLGQMRQAVGAFTRSDGERVAQGLDRARDLVRGLESMRERTEAAANRAEREQQNAPGQPGQQQGQQGQQQGQQGQQQGQPGQQQGQPGQQQGQPGQQQGNQGQQQAQGGQQGNQPGQNAQPGAQQGGGQRGDNRNPPNASNFGGGRTAPGLTGEQARQLRGEARERLAEAEGLRRELQAQGQDTGALDDIMRQLRELDRAGIYGNADQLRKIQGDVVEDMKAFEFALRRALLGESRDKLYLSGSDEVPEGFRKLVEEYYRQLSRRQ